MELHLLVVLLAGVLVINNSNCAASTDIKLAGLPISLLNASVTQATQDRTVCEPGKQFGCVNCTTRMMCDSGQNIISVVNCGKDAPFCKNAVCTTASPSPGECPQMVSPLCPVPSESFPSTTSCTRYVKCDENKVATEYQCPANLVYDPATKICKRRTLASDCPIINCAYYRNKFIVYPLDKRIYFYCGASNNDIKVLRCPNNDEEFNPTLIVCEKKCTDFGFIESPDPTKYYMCVKNSDGSYDKYLQECPTGTTFINSKCSA